MVTTAERAPNLIRTYNKLSDLQSLPMGVALPAQQSTVDIIVFATWHKILCCGQDLISGGATRTEQSADMDA